MTSLVAIIVFIIRIYKLLFKGIPGSGNTCFLFHQVGDTEAFWTSDYAAVSDR